MVLSHYYHVIPSSARLPLQFHQVSKSLRRLSRDALVSLALAWLESRNLADCAPTLDHDAPDPVNLALSSNPLSTVAQVRQRFESARELKDSKKEILEAIETHWTNGLSLQQWAMVDQARIESEMSSKPMDSTVGGALMHWSCLRAQKVRVHYAGIYGSYNTVEVPSSMRLDAAEIAREIQNFMNPVAKTHIDVLRPSSLGTAIVLRIIIFGDEVSLNNEGSQIQGAENVKSMFLALPEADNLVYVSPANVPMDGSSIQSLVLQALARQISKIDNMVELVSCALEDHLTFRDIIPKPHPMLQTAGLSAHAVVTPAAQFQDSAQVAVKEDGGSLRKTREIKTLKAKLRFRHDDPNEADF